MSRTLATGNYDAAGNFVIHGVMKISPNSVFGIGNSIGGYFARPINYAGSSLIALHRVSGSEKELSIEQLNKKFRGEKGIILKHGMTGLWATSSGSARRGIFHRYVKPEEGTDILKKIIVCLLGLGAGVISYQKEGPYEVMCGPRESWFHDGVEKPTGFLTCVGWRSFFIDASYAIRMSGTEILSVVVWSHCGHVKLMNELWVLGKACIRSREGELFKESRETYRKAREKFNGYSGVSVSETESNKIWREYRMASDKYVQETDVLMKQFIEQLASQ